MEFFDIAICSGGGGGGGVGGLRPSVLTILLSKSYFPVFKDEWRLIDILILS